MTCSTRYLSARTRPTSGSAHSSSSAIAALIHETRNEPAGRGSMRVPALRGIPRWDASAQRLRKGVSRPILDAMPAHVQVLRAQLCDVDRVAHAIEPRVHQRHVLTEGADLRQRELHSLDLAVQQLAG